MGWGDESEYDDPICSYIFRCRGPCTYNVTKNGRFGNSHLTNLTHPQRSTGLLLYQHICSAVGSAVATTDQIEKIPLIRCFISAPMHLMKLEEYVGLQSTSSVRYAHRLCPPTTNGQGESTSWTTARKLCLYVLYAACCCIVYVHVASSLESAARADVWCTDCPSVGHKRVNKALRNKGGERWSDVDQRE